MPVVHIPCKEITDWDSFHGVFARVLGFPDFYGKNMNSWVDCLTYVDEPGDGMSNVVLRDGEILTLELEEAKSFRDRLPEQFDALVSSAAFVNWRRAQMGRGTAIALSYSLV